MLKDLIIKNRSYRGYDSGRKVTREELEDMVDCARLSASSVNRQPLKYYLAWEQEEVDRIQALTKWARGLPELTLPHPGKNPAAFIVICQDMLLGDSKARFQKDVGIAAQSILLRAVEMGLGGCMIGNFSPAAIKETLELSPDLEPVLIVAVGKPDEKIVLTEAAPGDSVDYYRDDEDVHYVPKRRLQDVVLSRKA
ncbi:MAG TPA: nitroreductase family protein [Candidatus Choladousia intestinavium]|uniref:Nitroreductase family protein n=1 Tax=Candidatus Choladousia intestinavium TaxID=2840727 RepID=A0A9D1AGC1_9FIRM|nr:nitroreductase family protein [Candidatus Choladousia intestinavium]